MDKPIINLSAEDVPGFFGITGERAKELKDAVKNKISEIDKDRGQYNTKDIIEANYSVANTVEEFGLCMFFAGIDQCVMMHKVRKAEAIAALFSL